MALSHLRSDGRYCGGCKLVKPLTEFHTNKSHHNRRCLDCTRASVRAYYHAHKARHMAAQLRYERRVREMARAGDKRWHARYLFEGARTRANRFGVPFTITPNDIHIPDVCPALGIPLKINRGKMREDSATVDRINPSAGYVPGNIVVVSLKANLIKSSATAADVLRVGMFYAQITARDIAV